MLADHCWSYCVWCVCVLLSLTAKHHCLPQPRGPQWLTVPARWHGGTSLYAAVGEGGANGRHSGAQRPACGAAWRGLSFLFFFRPRYCWLSSICLSTCLSSGISPITFSLPGSTTLSVSFWFSYRCFLFSSSLCSFVTIDFLVVYAPELMDLSTLAQKIRTNYLTSLLLACQAVTYPFKVDLGNDCISILCLKLRLMFKADDIWFVAPFFNYFLRSLEMEKAFLLVF